METKVFKATAERMADGKHSLLIASKLFVRLRFAPVSGSRHGHAADYGPLTLVFSSAMMQYDDMPKGKARPNSSDFGWSIRHALRRSHLAHV